MAALMTAAKAALLNQAIKQITGEEAILDEQADYVRISFTPSQQVKLRAFLNNQLKPKPPGDLRIDVMPVVLPLAIQKAAPFVLAVFAAGVLVGKKL
jgi:hypothetical protein